VSWLHAWTWYSIVLGVALGVAFNFVINCLVPPRETRRQWLNQMLALPKTIWWFLRGMP
jgi:hypothetical protein